MSYIALFMVFLAVATQIFLSGAAAFGPGSTLLVLSVPFAAAWLVARDLEFKSKVSLTVFFLFGQFWIATLGYIPDPGFGTFIKVTAPVTMTLLAFFVHLKQESRHGDDGNYLFYFSLISGFSAATVSDGASISYGLIYGTLLLAGLIGGFSGLFFRLNTSGLRKILNYMFLVTTSASIIFGSLPNSVGGILIMLFLGAGAFKSVRSVSVAAMLLLPLLIFGCSPLKPSGGRYAAGTVMFQLSEEGLNLLLSENWNVRVRVHKVENGNRGDQEGNDAIFNATDSTPTFKLDGVKLGLKDFVLDIINASNESVGSGSARHLVRPGIQTLSEIRIKLIPPDQRRRELPMNWIVRVKGDGEQPKTTYQDVKQIFTDNRCLRCHSSDSPDGNLDLSQFPFTYINEPRDQAYIVNEILTSIKSPDYPMPPSPPRVPQDQVAQVQKWFDDGLLKFPVSDNTSDLAHKIIVHWELPGTSESGTWEVPRPSDANEPFKCKLENAVIGGRYKFRSEVIGIDGSRVLEKSFEYTVAPEGDALIEVELEGGVPSVSIPIVIER